MHVHNFKDETGNRYNNLTVVQYAGRNDRRKAMWECLCDCGKIILAQGTYLRANVKKHCGCMNPRGHGPGYKTHGMTAGCHGSYSGLYKTWTSMLQRSTNPNHDAYARYGGRGITVYEGWKTFIPFMEWALDNGFEKGLEIDRIDNDGNYTPDNCRFVTNKTNMRNRGNTKYATYQNQTKSLGEWAEIYNFPYDLLYRRLEYGWDIGKALTKPVQKHRRGEGD